MGLGEAQSSLQLRAPQVKRNHNELILVALVVGVCQLLGQEGHKVLHDDGNGHLEAILEVELDPLPQINDDVGLALQLVFALHGENSLQRVREYRVGPIPTQYLSHIGDDVLTTNLLSEVSVGSIPAVSVQEPPHVVGLQFSDGVCLAGRQHKEGVPIARHISSGERHRAL